MSARVPIVRANRREADGLSWLIASAFSSLAVSEWLVPTSGPRRRVLHRNFRIWVEHAFDHGEVWTTHGRTGVAVWFPRTEPLPGPANYDVRLTVACGAHVERFRILDAAFEKHHPTEPHHHLAFLAVAVEYRSQGIGSALLDHHHTRLDHAGIASYLEASSIDSRRLYARHGYEDHGPPLTLLDTNASLWPMWREPRSTGGPGLAGDSTLRRAADAATRQDELRLEAGVNSGPVVRITRWLA